ncbi:SnoaL-like domain-containing protein [Kushneria avicenniae]|uniref:SnoaL-like domain-containing protein n=1 Tax=Kushneria avicenniae TaxID=402385 RepID=A0A1I1G6L6_9GAMM|nr:nuclear transport factor 2 family protein [Kushneria avicenniae]SFC07185.1 SnoaL-like domain-containing protein [Kushneria avicenniae]
MNMNDDQQARLVELLDREAIRQLRNDYSRCLDSGNIDGLSRVFTEDASLEVTVGAMEGLEAIKAGLRDAYRQFDRDGRGHYPFVHVIANHEIRLTGADSAEGQCYLIDFETASKTDDEGRVDKNPLLLLGLYHDRYQRVDGEWRIAYSKLDVVWPSQAD